MDAWPYAVVDNSQKRGTGNRERGTGNLGTPVFVNQGGKRSYKHPTCAVFVKQGGKRSYECDLPRHRPWPCQGVRSAEYRVKNSSKGNAGDLTQRPRRVRALHAPCLRAIRVNNPRACGARTLHLPFFAPTGRRTVATGEAPAAAQRTVRNPWKRSCFNTPAPRGRRNRRAQASFRRPPNLLRPVGARRG